MDLVNTILITHKGCSDGTGCALMFLEAGGKLENIHFVSAGKVDDYIKENNLLDDPRFILMADISVSKEDCIAALEKRGNVLILDHHKTSIEPLGQKSWATIDMSACGTELLRRHLNLNEDYYVDYAAIVDDIDRWVRNKLPWSEDLAEFHRFVGQEEYLKSFYYTGLKRRHKDTWIFGTFAYRHLSSWLFPNEQEVLQFVKRRRESKIKEAVEKVIIRDVEINGELVKIGYTLSKGSDLLAVAMLEKYPDIEVACFFNLETGSVSLRSRGEFDVTKIASLYGGGGHRASAGHYMPRSLIMEFVEGIHS